MMENTPYSYNSQEEERKAGPRVVKVAILVAVLATTREVLHLFTPTHTIFFAICLMIGLWFIVLRHHVKNYRK